MTEDTVQAGQPEETATPSEGQQPGHESPPVEKKEDAPRSKRDRRAERRISRLTARNAELMEAQRIRDEQFAKMQAEIEALKQPKPVRPQRDDFESQEAYEDALIDFRLKGEKKPEPTTETQANPDLVQRFESFIADNGDEFGKVVASAHFPLTDHALSEIIDMGEDGAGVFTHLNSNPTEAMRISRLSPRDQTIELEKLADSLEDTKPDVSEAPEPITPVDGNDKPVVDESRLSDDDWIARRNKKVFGH